jgi:hypothetical protein
MKFSKLHLLTGILLLALLAPLAPLAHAQLSVNPLWTGTFFKGMDPYYGITVTGYKQGGTASLVLAITNTAGNYVNVTGANVIMDWGTNYPTTGISASSPLRINPSNQGTVTISFTVPTSVSNLVTHGFRGNVNFTITGIPGQQQDLFFGTGFAVYSADQATDISLMQQLGLTSTFGLFSGIGLCGFAGSSFKTAEGSSLCLQASQQAAQGQALYASGNFTGSKSYIQNAVSLWNQALNAENTKGASIEQGTMLGGYGGLLLGIGALIGGVAAVIYAFKRHTPATH